MAVANSSCMPGCLLLTAAHHRSMSVRSPPVRWKRHTAGRSPRTSGGPITTALNAPTTVKMVPNTCTLAPMIGPEHLPAPVLFLARRQPMPYMPENKPEGVLCQDWRQQEPPKGLGLYSGSRLVGYLPGMESKAGDLAPPYFRAFTKPPTRGYSHVRT